VLKRHDTAAHGGGKARFNVQKEPLLLLLGIQGAEHCVPGVRVTRKLRKDPAGIRSPEIHLQSFFCSYLHKYIRREKKQSFFDFVMIATHRPDDGGSKDL
jgi:hypothetical protein